MKNLLKEWMGNDFFALHPLLQELHSDGGVLEGDVNIRIPKFGLSHYLGKKLATKLGLPSDNGKHSLKISISQQKDKIIWDRTFDEKYKMTSIFKPVGIKESGFLLEESGPVKMRLTVDVKNGAWHWRWLDVSSKQKSILRLVFPYSKAYKYINDKNEYVFSVQFKLFGLGQILSYEGILERTK